MNITPKTIRRLELSATRALSAAGELGAIIGLKASDAPAIATDRHDLMGRPADPTATPPVTAILGKQPLYREAKVQHALARAARRQSVTVGYDFVAQAVNTLKGVLGRKWNSNWAALGFTAGSLRLPKNPLVMLAMLGAYYRTHPEREVAVLNLTSDHAEMLKAAILAAQGAADAAHVAESTAKQLRDAALTKLRRRISALRDELTYLLSPDDARWSRFGFRRPVDGSTPDLVEEVDLSPAGAGQVLVQWNRARLAESYRVSWEPSAAGPDVEPTQVGLFSDLQTVITGLTAGGTIKVIVTARNSAGESAPTEANISVP